MSDCWPPGPPKRSTSPTSDGDSDCRRRLFAATFPFSKRSIFTISCQLGRATSPPKWCADPKLHLVDSGLAAHLIGVDAAGLARPTSVHAGPLLESFVAGEIARQLTWSTSDATLYHWRDRNGVEVDLVLETSDGTVAGLEVKAAVDVDESDFRGLRTLRGRLGDQFSCGVVIHCGDRPRPFGPKLYAVPISTLWSAT